MTDSEKSKENEERIEQRIDELKGMEDYWGEHPLQRFSKKEVTPVEIAIYELNRLLFLIAKESEGEALYNE